MSNDQTVPRRGRPHDAAGTREAILNAAEQVFAQHGFDGARIDTIAEVAGYNKSLIFSYFGDKLGLYTAIIRRVDEQTRDLQTRALTTLLENQTELSIAKVKELLRTYLAGYFDYLVEHPHIGRILVWEMAEGWQIYQKIIVPTDFEDIRQFQPSLQMLSDAGLIRANLHPVTQVVILEMMLPAILASLPLSRVLVPDEDTTSPSAMARVREFIVDFITQGLIVTPNSNTP